MPRPKPELKVEDLDDPVDSGGEWVVASKCPARKSFGAFECASKTCDKRWVSAHAFKDFTQGCKECEQHALPKFMWVNHHGRQATHAKEENLKLDKPHDNARCSACKAGVCLGSRSDPIVSY